ncbi:MAG TPA: type III-A CRISPR-associated RAMP protein Csm4 [Melioribacteraceae bacterium]|nr:type III-A CRISPR-associated RAMP protein Csm4 [Melioribacteraceae bacterium]
MKIIYLKPKSSFRNNLRSDTLWGLLCWGINNIFGENKLNEFIKSYETEGTVFKVSSAFPYIDLKGERTLYFPRPILKPIDINDYFDKYTISSKKERSNIIGKLKSFKKVKYLEEKTFINLLNGKITEYDLFTKYDLWENDLVNNSFRTIDIMHNTINRLTNSTLEGNLFIDSDIFSNKAGLFFLIDGSDEQIKLATAALRFYSHIGFAGDSAIGKGYFETFIEDYNMVIPNGAKNFITLSLYAPAQNETIEFKKYQNLFWYEIETRKGKYGGQHIKDTNFWKDSVLMFKEGSVFPNLNKTHYGINKIVKRASNFDVVQFGFAFNLPFITEC